MLRRSPLAILSRLLLTVSFMLPVTGCAPSIAPFSEHAYERAVALKVDALTLMAEADEPFDAHRTEVEGLRAEVEKAYEFARGRPKNEISTRQWEFLKDPDRNLLGGFLRRWEEQGRLSPVFVTEAQRLIADAFDTVIGLESGKVRPDAIE